MFVRQFGLAQLRPPIKLSLLLLSSQLSNPRVMPACSLKSPSLVDPSRPV